MLLLTFEVPNLTHLLTLYDQAKVYRSATIDGTYSEVTSVADRVDLVAGTTVYEYLDMGGDVVQYYKIAYFNSGTLDESELSEVVPHLWIGIEDVRNEGVTVAKASDSKVYRQILAWQSFVERTTGTFFVRRAMTFDLDGRGTTLLRLPHAIVSVDAVYANDDFSNALVEGGDYEVYDGRGLVETDDRRNPRIRLVTSETSIFEGVGAVAGNQRVFEVGERNQRVTGVFGFVEPDGSTPEPIRYALLRLVCASSLRKLGLVENVPGGPMIEEETDRHRVKWADPFVGTKTWTTSGDPEVDRILARYRRPIAIRAPRTLHRRNRRNRRARIP